MNPPIPDSEGGSKLLVKTDKPRWNIKLQLGCEGAVDKSYGAMPLAILVW